MLARCIPLLALPTLALGLPAPAGHGQCVLGTFEGDSPDDDLVQMSSAYDMSGDGYNDPGQRSLCVAPLTLESPPRSAALPFHSTQPSQ